MEINGSDKHILIVDDENIVRKMVQKILQKKGFTIHEAHNGSQAIEQAMRYKLDLIILDIMMPVMDGFQSLKILRNISKTKDVPVIILTAHANVRTFTRAVRLGATDFLAKPFSQHDLLRKIQFILADVEEKRKDMEELLAAQAAREGDPEWQRTRRHFIVGFENLFPRMISLVLRNDLEELRNLLSGFIEKTRFYNLEKATRITTHMLQGLKEHKSEELVGLLEGLYELFSGLIKEHEQQDSPEDAEPPEELESTTNSIENKTAQ